ncbi:mucin-2-like isoform X1 [Mytilus trossulus]|uniref:mucin-2-like isoform X1 n=1 Tax=Mytilus trossulus TaxID=6551 RepID=UPI00300732E2
MDIQLALFVFFAVCGFEFVVGLTCRLCYYAQDVTKCGATTQCPQDEHCGIHEFSMNGVKTYHAGCISTDVCEGRQDAPIKIFGKRRQLTTVKVQCCDTDLCNVDPNNVTTGLPEMNVTTTPSKTTGSSTSDQQLMTSNIPTTSTTCVDHSNCVHLLQTFPICTDSYTAKTVCPKLCGLCDTDTSAASHTSNQCVDTSNECELLIQHFQVCNDTEFSLARCRKSCNMCSQVTTTVPSVETPPPNRETPSPSRETPSPNRETPLPSQSSSLILPNIETPLPNRETVEPSQTSAPLPNIETPSF